MKALKLDKKVLVLIVVLVLLSIYNAAQMHASWDTINTHVAEIEEANRPADIQLTIISADCARCTPVEDLVTLVDNAGVRVTDKKTHAYDSDEGRELVEQYQITRVPTLLVAGEIERSPQLRLALARISEETENGFVVTQIAPPYVNPETGNTHGLVGATILKKMDCEDCFSLDALTAQFESLGVILDTEDEVDVESDEGRALIERYSIERAPTLILDNEAHEYDVLKQSWGSVGTIESDAFVMRQTSPPYYDIEKGEVVGRVQLTIISDESCDVCYDAGAFHKAILPRMGVALNAEVTYDMASGVAKELMNKYSITKVPTVILTGDPGEYTVLARAWGQVGTVESDGAYVFRNTEVGGTYRDLESGEITVVENS